MEIFAELLSSNNHLSIFTSEYTTCNFLVGEVSQLEPQAWMLGGVSSLITERLGKMSDEIGNLAKKQHT